MGHVGAPALDSPAPWPRPPPSLPSFFFRLILFLLFSPPMPSLRYKQLLPGTHNAAVPNMANDAVLVGSEEMPPGSVTIEGYDFNNGVDYHAMFKSFFRTGYQVRAGARCRTPSPFILISAVLLYYELLSWFGFGRELACCGGEIAVRGRGVGDAGVAGEIFSGV